MIARGVVEGLGLKWDATLDKELIASLQSRRTVMHAAWLSHVGHKRPGMKPGLPVDEARSSVAELGRTISRLVEESR